ncbi:MAG: hypothetical protein AB7G93_20790 [Bdellovibrionales bacterium]
MDLGKALENLKRDVRMRDWNLNQGLTSKDEVKAQIESLPDLSEQCEAVTLEDKGDFGD